MKVGIIGNGKHAQRIKNILKKKKIEFFIYKPQSPKYFDKKKFEYLKRYKVIFILTPNKVHFKYINLLRKDRYIFCEKPPVSTKSQINFLKKINKSKIYFNFNFRFSKLAWIFDNIRKYNLQNLIYININLTHGLALSREYKKNWRSNKNKNNLGVLEMVLIHYIDLINHYFKLKKKISFIPHKFSDFGSSFDTCKVMLKSQKNVNVDLFASYSAPFYRNIMFLFKNGYIHQDEKKISIMGPATNKNKKNMFIKPKKKLILNANYLKDYEESLEKSVSFFLQSVKKNKKFKNSLFKSSIESNEIMIGAKK